VFKTILFAFAIFVAYLIGSFCLSYSSTGFDPNTTTTPTLEQDQDQDAEDIKTAARKAFMQGKLESNKKIVHGLTTKNYPMIKEGAQDVTALVKGQHWFVLDTPEYKSYSQDMSNIALKLEKAADDKNLEAAALRYFDLTVSCIDCHQYIEKQRY